MLTFPLPSENPTLPSDLIAHIELSLHLISFVFVFCLLIVPWIRVRGCITDSIFERSRSIHSANKGRNVLDASTEDR
jgi:hypothetical protein